MINLFKKYLTVGVFNTAIHWTTFLSLIHFLGLSQTVANLIAFCIAVSFSFIINSKWTFSVKATLLRYFIFTFFMAFIATLTGYIADKVSFSPFITLVVFSGSSLIIGFLYSKYIVFRN